MSPSRVEADSNAEFRMGFQCIVLELQINEVGIVLLTNRRDAHGGALWLFQFLFSAPWYLLLFFCGRSPPGFHQGLRKICIVYQSNSAPLPMERIISATKNPEVIRRIATPKGKSRSYYDSDVGEQPGNFV